mmetsp:Transcript_30805/g.96434  ORF Transcript_30805/g.96434 Transcript_30805/m.96434 type:complete len:312 (-) Transcript_30805:802-1737(-)
MGEKGGGGLRCTVRRLLPYVSLTHTSQVQGEGLHLAPSLAAGGVVQISHGREHQSGAQRAPRQQQSEQHAGEASCEGQRSARAMRARVEERTREARRRGGEGDRAGRDDEGLRLRALPRRKVAREQQQHARPEPHPGEQQQQHPEAQCGRRRRETEKREAGGGGGERGQQDGLRPRRAEGSLAPRCPPAAALADTAPTRKLAAERKKGRRRRRRRRHDADGGDERLLQLALPPTEGGDAERAEHGACRTGCGRVADMLQPRRRDVPSARSRRRRRRRLRGPLCHRAPAAAASRGGPRRRRRRQRRWIRLLH